MKRDFFSSFIHSIDSWLLDFFHESWGKITIPEESFFWSCKPLTWYWCWFGCWWFPVEHFGLFGFFVRQNMKGMKVFQSRIQDSGSCPKGKLPFHSVGRFFTLKTSFSAGGNFRHTIIGFREWKVIHLWTTKSHTQKNVSFPVFELWLFSSLLEGIKLLPGQLFPRIQAV